MLAESSSVNERCGGLKSAQPFQVVGDDPVPGSKPACCERLISDQGVFRI